MFFQVLLQEQDTTRKGRVYKKVTRCTKTLRDVQERYEADNIWDKTVFAKESKAGFGWRSVPPVQGALGSLHWQFDPWKLNSQPADSNFSSHFTLHLPPMTCVVAELCGQWPVWPIICVVDDLCGCPLNQCLDDLYGWRPVWLSSQSMPWWPVWSTTCLVVFSTNALMICMVDDLCGCLFNQCFDDLCGQQLVWLSFQSTL